MATFGQATPSAFGHYRAAGTLYIEWFNSQSYNIYKDFDLKHFVFMTPNDIVEVISIYPPKITLF